MQKKSYSVDIAGKTLTADFTDLTEHAHGSVMLRMGETVVLVTAVMGEEEKPGMPYFPLSVDFEEKFYAAGQILGSRFMRREGRPSDEAVLSARIVDRTIRPLFDHSIRYDVQVVITVLAMGEDDPDVLGVIGASLALATSNIPWAGPVGAVRIGKDIAGNWVFNPTYKERAEGALPLEVLACGKDGNVNMIETAGNEVSESEILAALEESVKIHNTLLKFQQDIIAEIGKEKRAIKSKEIPEDVQALFDSAILPKLSAVLFSEKPGKAHLYELKDEWFTLLKEQIENPNNGMAADMFEHAIDAELHRGALEEGKRADGRAMDEVRSLYAQAGGVSPVLHGSGIFYRGGTHIFTALTLGGPEDSQLIDSMEERDVKKRFMHHYNFPPFSVGEAGRVGGFNRRMIGHGALAEKALVPVIPPKDEFPYTIRLVSETMASNGSSSMGSVCGSTLALLDGGVPIMRHVAGIASGLMMESPEKYALLTDIQGPEDEHGDMDFKVAGTREGVTAMQMDVKVGGIPVKILGEALEKAKQARLQIIEVMEKEMPTHRPDISPRAPKIITLSILSSQIGLVIGGGGKTINGIKDDTGVQEISIEEDGTIYITGKDGTAEKAAERIRELTRVFAVGEKMDAVITRIAPFGAFARLNGSTEGLIHISEIVPWRLEDLDGVLAEGETVSVVVTKVEDGKVGLSIKQVDPEFGAKKGLTAPEHN
ncbi:polyribonucleotide nucleotidyltransferase [Candidatus Parcubacteria bacterium]|uniref:Polyribonucleotide nucleotidyltransferase n=1 Tax=Candidatus Kaiserbacteria bacterium CG10_big_fil_rev_8_21_14_0_10_47_16 TaxID=1974608 RepID=A0A2H0UFF9_9BACT|nr:polyribonucleotide nucleotidyltransferase [Candidatus Parcubacteria bacterium]PIR84525.1 MAG: polyribonucleotide nucleotidyltransferase [Candidatus Kaiserbacteria bacterium CG10_big_fil_rev_8_21_14_0_10_47_16]